MNEVQVKTAVRERDGNRCTKCGMTVAEHKERYGKTVEVHRVVPGSAYAVDGCVTLCRHCHGPEPRRPRGQRFKDEGVIQVLLPLDIDAALKNYLKSIHVPPTMTAVTIAALREFLKREGFYPPQPSP